MNAGKLVAQITVLAIVVYCCYGAFASAMPSDMTNPISISGPEGEESFKFSTSCPDGLNLTISVDGNVHSNLPQDIKDVRIQFFLGSAGMRTMIADEIIGTIAKGVTPVHASLVIPTYTVLAYAITGISDGQMKIPIAVSLAFKYLEWQGSHLIDLNLLSSVTVPVTTGVTLTPEISTGDNGTKVSVDLDKSTEDTGKTLLESAIEYFGTAEHTITAPGGATITVKATDNSSSYNLTMEATGTDLKNAAQILKDALTDDGLKLTFDGSTEITIPKENAETYIALIELLYAKGVVP